METTKQLSKIYVPKSLVKQTAYENDDSVLQKIFDRILNTLKKEFNKITNLCMEASPWIKTNYGCYLWDKNIFIPCTNKWPDNIKDISKEKILDIYDAEALPFNTGRLLFCKGTRKNDLKYFLNNPFIKEEISVGDEVYFIDTVDTEDGSGGIKRLKIGSSYDILDQWFDICDKPGINRFIYGNYFESRFVPYVKMDNNEFLVQVLKKCMTVYEFPKISELVRSYGGNFQCSMENLKKTADFLELDISDLLSGGENIKYQTSYTQLPESISSYFLCTDKDRANLNTYENDILFDSHRGTWDLWPENSKDDFVGITTEQKIYARNPVADVKRNSVVGIDFGTKSTVVAFQDSDVQTKLMRIGVSNYDDEVKLEHYENPTVMEFCNIVSFMEAYNSESSRPRTSWNDLTVSHHAFHKMNDSNDYYSFFYDIKQWSNSADHAVLKMTDQNQNDFDIKPYISMEDGDFDPIEIYAYYLGLYINNMRNRIYMKYILSYPVAYPQKVREKIISSFAKGLKKSIPQAVLENDEIMRGFSVKAGTSEPAAYAICALKEYGFTPKPGECVCYGIYDFGGGTTDFDFGQWRCANDDEVDDGYNYVIKHYGDGGVPTLGGENLIELLAYEVLKDNKSKLKSDEKYKFTFFRPVMGERFEGDENLVNDSKESRQNLKKVAELLRPLWEGGIELKKKTGDKDEDTEMPFVARADFIKPTSVNLIPRTGGSSESVELEIDMEKLIRILVGRIQMGVDEFFRAYELVYKSQSGSEGYNPEIYHIFLAGKASQSAILKYCFEEKIKLYTEKIISKLKELNQFDYKAEIFFKLFPSLGTAEADEMIGISDIKQDVMRVTGKTGVAYGLVEGRESGDIKVESDIKPTEESRFKYYIGRGIRGKFSMITDRDIRYDKWYKFLKASRQEVELYFSELPSVTVGETDISDKGVIKRTIVIDEPHDHAIIVYRAIAIDTIEYAVSENEGSADNGDYIYGPVDVKLSSE